jgi:hypothetical protein
MGDPDPQQIVQILLRHARIRGGRAVRCGPSHAEEDGTAGYWWRARQHKVIYDTREAAEAASAELTAAGSAPSRPYPCPRSTHGHYHLTEDRSPATKQRHRLKRWTPPAQTGTVGPPPAAGEQA